MISPIHDALFFIATPMLTFAILVPLRAFWDSQSIQFFVLCFFALGHHFPTWVRAYGEPNLFNGYKEKFIISPLVVLAVVGLAQFYSLHGLFLMVVVWEVWHLFMQHYGVMRIYDAKAKIFAKRDVHLDWLLTFFAFLTVIFYSAEYMHRIFDTYLKVGLPFFSPELFKALQPILLATTLAIGAAYVWNIIQRLRQGLPVSWPKIASMGAVLFLTFFGFVYIRDLVIGYAAFAMYHDVQYFAIVWLYEHQLVNKGKKRTTAFLRALFASRALPVVALYVLLCFGYGSINLLVGYLKSGTAIKIVEVFVISSTLLHYYYDGIIWKVRRRDTRDNLGIEEAPATGPGREALGLAAQVHRLGSFARETGRQLLYFAFPVALMTLVQLYGRADSAQAREDFVEMFPDLPGAHNNLGVAYADRGDLERARRECEKAVELDPQFHEAHLNLGLVHARQGRMEEAHQEYQRAIELKPGYVQALNAQGLILMGRNAHEKAIECFQKAVEELDYAPAYNNLGLAFLHQGDFARAAAAYQEAIDLEPRNASYRFNLGLAYEKQGDDESAIAAFKEAIVLRPDYSKAYLSMALSFQRLGKIAQARQALQQLLRLNPGDETAIRLLKRL
jgi:Tfp pilus assembly protein PilF